MKKAINGNATYTVCGETALAVVRALRRKNEGQRFEDRTDLPVPSPGAKGRWLAESFDLSRFGLANRASKEAPIMVAVPSAQQRLRNVGVENTVHSKNLPRRAFFHVGDGVYSSSPELLFVEMANVLSPFEHILLGMELTGTYSLDAVAPDSGTVAYGLAPATSLAELTSFVAQASGLNGVVPARKTLRVLRENAWSPMEALVGALLALPANDCGYGLGPIVLNKRIAVRPGVAVRQDAVRQDTVPHADSRVPDIVFVGTNVGLNYDGEDHFGIRDVQAAVGEAIAHPESSSAASALDRMVLRARERVVADKQRDRDLIANGMLVLSVTKEDLNVFGGLDFAIAQAISLLEREAGSDVSLARAMMRFPYVREFRQNLIWSSFPNPNRERAREWLAHQDAPIAIRPDSVETYLVETDSNGSLSNVERLS